MAPTENFNQNAKKAYINVHNSAGPLVRGGIQVNHFVVFISSCQSKYFLTCVVRKGHTWLISQELKIPGKAANWFPF